MKGHAYSTQEFSSSEETEAKTEIFSSLEDIEKYFNRLSEITDRVAMINSDYQTDIETALSDLENFFQDEEMLIPLGEMEGGFVKSILSHMSFHREIIADIINEARQLLIEERREYLRRLVAYHKTFVKSFSVMEKRAYA